MPPQPKKPTPPERGIEMIRQAFAAGQLTPARSKPWATGSAARIPSFLKEPDQPKLPRRGGDPTESRSIWDGRPPLELPEPSPAQAPEERVATKPAKNYIEPVQAHQPRKKDSTRRAAGRAIHKLLIEENRAGISFTVRQPNGGRIIIQARYLPPLSKL